MLTIDSNRKLDTVQFLEHICVPRQNLINLVRPMPSWRPFTKLFVFSSQWQYRLPNQISNSEILRLDLLVVCTGNFSLILLDFFPATKALALSGPPHYRSSRLHTVRQIDHSETQYALIRSWSPMVAQRPGRRLDDTATSWWTHDTKYDMPTKLLTTPHASA